MATYIHSGIQTLYRVNVEITGSLFESLDNGPGWLPEWEIAVLDAVKGAISSGCDKHGEWVEWAHFHTLSEAEGARDALIKVAIQFEGKGGRL